MTATATKPAPKGHVAPVHSPNEFHVDPETGGLVAGLGTTQYPAVVKPVSHEEMEALRDRELAVAEAESRAEQLIADAQGKIAQMRAKLEAERAEFEAEKKAAATAKAPKQAK